MWVEGWAAASEIGCGCGGGLSAAKLAVVELAREMKWNAADLVKCLKACG